MRFERVDDMLNNVGLKWRKCETRPSTGEELINGMLSIALADGKKTSFTREELAKLGINDLRSDHFVRTVDQRGDGWFQPVDNTSSFSNVRLDILKNEFETALRQRERNLKRAERQLKRAERKMENTQLRDSLSFLQPIGAFVTFDSERAASLAKELWPAQPVVNLYQSNTQTSKYDAHFPMLHNGRQRLVAKDAPRPGDVIHEHLQHEGKRSTMARRCCVW
jgi:hypothetical protein